MVSGWKVDLSALRMEARSEEKSCWGGMPQPVAAKSATPRTKPPRRALRLLARFMVFSLFVTGFAACLLVCALCLVIVFTFWSRVCVRSPLPKSNPRTNTTRQRTNTRDQSTFPENPITRRLARYRILDEMGSGSLTLCSIEQSEVWGGCTIEHKYVQDRGPFQARNFRTRSCPIRE